MKYATLNADTFALRLELGDDIHSTIQTFCSRHNIANAAIEAIGSVESPVLAYYSSKDKQFTTKQLEGFFEITSLLVNVALVDGQPLAHLHITVSGPDMTLQGGHLVKGECAATIEVVLKSFPTHHTKSLNESMGLKLWDFNE